MVVRVGAAILLLFNLLASVPWQKLELPYSCYAYTFYSLTAA